uniref:Uncharacterized protein n=1 Tax=Anopheles coluzzii TaxID=1518534 RepID=A0A8W7PPS9_ANOCL
MYSTFWGAPGHLTGLFGKVNTALPVRKFFSACCNPTATSKYSYSIVSPPLVWTVLLSGSNFAAESLIHVASAGSTLFIGRKLSSSFLMPPPIRQARKDIVPPTANHRPQPAVPSRPIRCVIVGQFKFAVKTVAAKGEKQQRRQHA